MCLAAALACGAPLRAQPAIDPAAFVALPPCRVEPFDDPDVQRYAEDLTRECGGDSAHVEFDAPRVGDEGAAAQLVARVDGTDTQRFGPLLATLRVAGTAAGDSVGGLRIEQAMVGAGGLLELDGTLALRAQVGVETAGELRRRARVAGLWASDDDLLYGEWTGSDAATERYGVGLRWHFMNKRIAIEVAARRTPWSDGWIDPRIELSLPGLGE